MITLYYHTQNNYCRIITFHLVINDIFMTKHLVFGAGLIGSFIGGVLTACREEGDQVCLYVRNSMAEKLASGITLTDYQNNRIALEHVHTVTHFDDSPTNENIDFIWLTVKCISVADAIADLRIAVSAKTVIICAQNGLGSDKLIRKAFPENLVLRAMVPFNVIVEDGHHFHRGSEGCFTIESSIHNQVLRSALTNVSINSGKSDAILPLGFTDEMTALQWAKLQLNLGNSVNALANIPVKSMLEQREYRLVIAEMMRELLKVTTALGVTLPKVTSIPARWVPRVLSLPDFLFKRVANKMLTIDPTVRTSMWWDLEQGRKTEIDYLNGVVVEVGQQFSIECKVNQSVIERVKILQMQDNSKRSSFSASQLISVLDKI